MTEHDRMVAAILHDADRDGLPGIMTDMGVRLSDRHERLALRLAREVLESARKWEWQTVEDGLDQLYRLVGGTNLGTGYAFHIGRHPAQIAWERLEMELGLD